jgi:hypothetical protein
MVRRIVIALGAVLIAAAPMAAQEHKMGEDMDMAKMMDSPWQQMNGFHKILHLIHQPMMKSGDVAMARQNAVALADAADTWARSTAPAECKAPADIADKVGPIAANARALAALVEAKGTDDEVKTAVGKLHEQFMGAHMACMPMGMKGMKGMKEHHPPPQ